MQENNKEIKQDVSIIISLTLFNNSFNYCKMGLILREYQNEIKAEVYKAWRAGIKNVLLVKATGLGKTKTFCSIAIEVAILGIIFESKYPTAIAVHRKELVQQISLTLSEEGIEHNIIAPPKVIKGIIAAQRHLCKKQFYNHAANITVISVDTLNSRILSYEKWAKSIRLWITDEAAHLLRANKWGRAVEYFPNAIGLGVTATPERLDKRGLGSHVDGVFDTMIVGPDTRWGIENGFLCNYRIVIPKNEYELHLKKSSGDADYSKEAMAVANQESKIVGNVVETYLKFGKGKQAIFFSSDINSGTELERKFTEVGVVAKLLTGDTEDNIRSQALMDYREKKIQALINVDLFDEGLDVPGIEYVGMVRPTMSLAKFLQMIGRGLRPVYAKGFDLSTPEGRIEAQAKSDKPFLILVDHVGNVKRHGLPDSKRKWSLNRVARRKKNLNLIRLCKNPVCGAPYDRILHKCPYCGVEDEPQYSRDGGGARVSPETVDGDLVMLDPDTLRRLQNTTQLEDPAKTAERVAAAAGVPAGLRAMKNQAERIKVQQELADTVALWAGRRRARGMTDRMIHKDFYRSYETTIFEILATPKSEMLDWIDTLKGDM